MKIHFPAKQQLSPNNNNKEFDIRRPELKALTSLRIGHKIHLTKIDKADGDIRQFCKHNSVTAQQILCNCEALA